MGPEQVRSFFLQCGSERGFVVNPPASSAEIAAAESALGCAFPPELRAIYEVMDGLDVEGMTPDLGLMALKEVVKFHVADVEGWAPPEDRAWWRKFGLVACWTDYNSNYIGIRVDEPARGMVVFLDHEDASPAPRYRSLESFLDQFEKGVAEDIEWHDWPTDFPLPGDVADDQVLAREYFWSQTGHLSEEEETYWFDSGASLVPKSQVQLVIPYLDSSNMWIQEIATRLIAKGELPGAMAHLERMALEGMGNARSEALSGIARLAGPDAFDVIESIAAKASSEVAEDIHETLEFFRRRVQLGLDIPS
jgi:SMI1/KNR4 family protein SUKH-1